VFGQALLAFALFYAAVVAGQEPRPQTNRPTRDTSALPRPTTTDPAAPAAEARPQPEAAPPFIARGLITNADGNPLRRVRISVQAERPPEPAYTDDQGRFEMIVPASSGSLRLSKAGYLSTTISRRDAQAAPVNLQLVKGAAINGTVTDSSGAPAVGVIVQVRRLNDTGGGGRGGGQYATDTDDLGEFRVGGLPAGRYTVSAGVGRGGLEQLTEFLGGNGGRGIGPLLDQFLNNGNGQIDENALRVLVEAANGGQIDAATLENAFGQGRGRGAQPDQNGRGGAQNANGRGRGNANGNGNAAGQGGAAANPNAAANGRAAAAAPTGTAQAQPQGRGGRGGRGPQVNPNDPIAELVAGQEGSVALVYDSPATTQLPQIASILDQAQNRAQLARSPTTQQAQTGTGSIRGRVYGHDGMPMKAASVQVVSVDGSGRRTGVTSDTGQYEITAVQPGRYRVRATKSGLVTVEYGQSRAQQPGRILEVTSNVRIQGVDLTIPKGGTLSGTLADQFGEPIEGANVQVWQARFMDGRQTVAPLANSRSRRTDDRGRYRIFGLLPGSYYVAASAQAGGRGGGNDGGGRGGRGGPPDGRGGDGGNAQVFYPGTNMVGSAVALQSDAGQDAAGIDILFNPGRTARVQGVARSSTGQPSQGRAYLAVSLRSGAPMPPLQSTGIREDGTFEFRDLAPGDYVVQVIEGTGGGGGRGRGNDPNAGQQGGRGGNRGGGGGGGGGNGGNRGQGGGGQPQAAGQQAQAGGQAGAVQGGGRGGGQGGGGRGGGQPGVAGGQQGRGQAGAGQPGNRGGGGFGQATPTRANAPAVSREFGTQYVTLAEGDTGIVTVETAPGVRMTGRIVLEGDSANTQASGFAFTAYPADPDATPLSGARTLRATVQSDGTFEIVDLVGSLRFGATRAPDGWWLKSVNVAGVNAALLPANFAKGSQTAEDVTVVFAYGTGAVEGRVLNDRKQPATDFNVIVFPPDSDRWFSQSPYVKLGSPKQDGTFTVEGLPPADYFVAAVDRIDAGTEYGDWQNPAVLEALAGSAKRVKVSSGQRVSSDVRLIESAR
jgi:protocatechuate 3,4-dioxygenase beta subunit